MKQFGIYKVGTWLLVPGMMEDWKVGILGCKKREVKLILMGLIFPYPSFHYSFIPIFHSFLWRV